uniref:PDZ domain-containing protein 8 n=1 Tax=Plectus sambesii TaxID=2011161 RepID=A0A914VZQ2_9BILA
MALGLILFGFVLGVCAVLAVLYIILLNPFGEVEDRPPFAEQFPPFRIPNELRQLLISQGAEDRLKRRETCVGLNLIIHFLYQEYKDTRWFRRWALKRLQLEFNDMTSRSATGRLLQDIKIRDLTVGTQFPVIKSMQVDKAQLSKDNESFEELDVLMDVEYRGGFTTSVDVTAILGRYAFLSIKVTRIAGKARLRLSRSPYTHWTFAFVEEPTMVFKLDSQFQGRPLKQLVPLIETQIRRAIARKHVLPNFKIRYRPLFPNPLLQPSAHQGDFDHVKVVGGLEVTVLSCSRLNIACAPVGWTEVYCVVSLASRPFPGAASSSMHFVSIALRLVRHSHAEPVGLTLARTSVAELGGGSTSRVVIVANVLPSSVANRAGFKESDILLAVNNVPIRNERHASKLINGTLGELTVLVERNLSKVEDFDDVAEKLVPGLAGTLKVATNDEGFMQVDFDDTLTQSDDRGRVESVSSANIDLAQPPTDLLKVLTNRRASSEADLSALIGQSAAMSIASADDAAAASVSPSSELRRTQSASLLRIEIASPDDADKVSGSSVSTNSELPLPATADDQISQSSAIDALLQTSIDRGRPGSTRRERLSAKATEVAARLQVSKAAVKELWNKHRRDHSSNADSHQSLAEFGIEADSADDNAGGADDGDTAEPGGSSARKPTEVNVVDSSGGAGLAKKRKRSKSAKRASRPVSVNVTHNLEEMTSGGESSPADEQRRHEKSTKGVELSENVLWGQSLHFALDKRTCRYMNVTIWSRVPRRTTDTVVQTTAGDDSPEVLRPVLLGYTSVYVPELIDDCAVTLSNCHRETFALRTTGQAIVPSQYQKLHRHPGFDSRLCYGDITLGFRYFPDGLPEAAEVDRDDHYDQIAAGTTTATDSLPSTPGLGPQKHHWIGVQLRHSVVCAMCRGKIWLKSASQCARCTVICHNKCVPKAATGIACVPDKIDDAQFEVLDLLPSEIVPPDHDGDKSFGAPVDVVVTSADLLVSPSSDEGNQPRRRRLKEKMKEKFSDWRSGRRKHSASGHAGDADRKRSSEQDPAHYLDGMEDAVSLKDSLGDLSDLMSSNPHFHTMLYTPGGTYNEHIISAAKDLGRDLFADLSLADRKQKINEQIDKIQEEINETTRVRLVAMNSAKAATSQAERTEMTVEFNRLDDRLQALAVLMLHYCAGLQNCVDLEDSASINSREEVMATARGSQDADREFKDSEQKGTFSELYRDSPDETEQVSLHSADSCASEKHDEGLM